MPVEIFVHTYTCSPIHTAGLTTINISNCSESFQYVLYSIYHAYQQLYNYLTVSFVSVDSGGSGVSAIMKILKDSGEVSVNYSIITRQSPRRG